METGGLSQWLNSLGLGEYEYNFVAQGYDLEVITSMGLEAQDFECLGIVKRGHMKKLKYESLKLKGLLFFISFLLLFFYVLLFYSYLFIYFFFLKRITIK